MHFAYEGFTHEGSKRIFQFSRVESGVPALLFTIEADLALLSKNKLSIQEAPLFCLKMLQSTPVSDEKALDRYRDYHLDAEDFKALNAERKQREAEGRIKGYVSRPRPVRSVLPTNLFNPLPRMTLEEPAKLLFTSQSISRNAPEEQGLYAISTSHEWIFIGVASDIRAALLEHLQTSNTNPSAQPPMGFAFECHAPAGRAARYQQLIHQYLPSSFEKS